MDNAHRFHEEAWETWRTGEVPDPSVLTFDELCDIQHWDMPGLPIEAHQAVLDEIGRRFAATDPCPTCGVKSPK